MKIATWNVNGIRAREAQLCEWIARDRPDIICLQEIKADPSQIPESCKLADYHAYWHGSRGYSGVSLHIRKELHESDPAYTHPDFDMETRIVQVALGNVIYASVYVPNGGKDYPAKINFFTRLAQWATDVHAQGRELVLCGDLNIARLEIDVHPRERKADVIGQRPEVGAMAQPAPAQHRMAHRLYPRIAFDSRTRTKLQGARRSRHQRSRAGDDEHDVAAVFAASAAALSCSCHARTTWIAAQGSRPPR
jgi:exodeoxyribonuclease III